MKEYIIIGVLSVGVIVLAIMVVRLLSRRDDRNNETYLQSDLASLRQEIAGLNTNLNQTLVERMDKTQDSVQTQLRQSAALVNDVSRRLTRLDETNRRVVDVADELKTLQNVLQNPKQRGVFGELYLNSVLENVLPPNQWQAQYRFSNGEAVDAVIFLDKGRVLPIDSKFSLENYNRYIEAKDKEIKNKLLSRVKTDLKNRIDETAKYIQKRVAQLGIHIAKYDEYLSKLGGSLGTTVSHFNNAYKEFAKIDKDVVKIKGDGSTKQINPESVDKPSL